jgi:hypothetical protein
MVGVVDMLGSVRSRTVLLAGAFMLSSAALAATAGASDGSNCTSGQVEAAGAVQLITDLPSQYTNSSIQLDLDTDALEMTLSVTDPSGNSVCENTDNLSRSCSWSPNEQRNFIVKVDNPDANANTYELCWQ